MKIRVLVINGPNLNMLGMREPETYGDKTYKHLAGELIDYGKNSSVDIEVFQSNHEGEIVEKIQKAAKKVDYIIINPAAYTHTSVAIRDALLAIEVPFVEVHLSNIYKREEFRHKSLLADIAIGQISGFGTKGYFLALDAVCSLGD